MRNLAALLLLGLTTACTSTVLAEPRVLVSPYYTRTEIRGGVALQSETPPVDNQSQNLRTFGQDHYKDGIGLRVDVGDGFGGLRAEYLRMRLGTSRRGILGDDWGQLLQGDVATMAVDVDDLRLGWIEPITKYETTLRDQPLTFRFGAGGVFGDMNYLLRARTDDGQRKQNVEIHGDVLFAAARARASWRDFALDVDFALSPHLELGGDWRGMPQDYEVRLSYTMPQRDLTFFAGYRTCKLPAAGSQDGLHYDASLRLDGYQLGLVLTF